MADPAGSPALLLHLLQRGLPCAVALVGTLEGERLVVEEVWPADASLIGKRLRVPAGLTGPRAAILDTASIRLPLDWTQLCGGRPGYLAAAPVEPGAIYLALVGRPDTARPDPVELEGVAGTIRRLLGTGEIMQRDRDTTERIRALVDNLPAPVVFVDSRMGEVFLNDPARDLLGVRVGATSLRIVGALRKLVASASGDLPALLLAEPRTDLTLDLQQNDQQYEVESRWIEEPRLAGRLWMFRDVTNERDAARFKDELVSNVSHELRTPLTSIIGALGLLKSGAVVELTPQAAGLIDIAHNNAQRLGRLVNDLLVMGRLEADRLEMQFARTDLCALLAETVTLNLPYAERFTVNLRLTVPEAPLYASVDPDRMVQVMGNLLSNAIKFSPLGGTVDVQLRREGSRLRISVIDQGRGMTAEFQKRLFTRFEQERESGAARSGTGLGLAISRGIVERLYGRIYVVSAPDQGSTFHIDLPVPEEA